MPTSRSQPHTPATPHSHLAVTGVSHSFGDRRVLTDISFTVAPGDRVGLVGENGTGKSTLLRILAGQQIPDAGSVRHAAPFAMLAQELPYPDETPMRRVLDDAQRRPLAALAEIEHAAEALADASAGAASERYAAALEEAERQDAWAAPSKRGDVLRGLGLSEIDATTPVGRLSGGQQIRLGLAALLLEEPHTLILDEPSNHLDDRALAYLESVLISWPGIVLVASHDRTLLDAITTRIFDLDPLPIPAAVLEEGVPGVDIDADPGSGMGLRVWGMGYTRARSERHAELSRWRHRYEAECAERAAILHEIEVGSREVNRKHESKSEAKISRKFYADKDARVTARRARNARVRLEQLERERVRRPPEPLRFLGLDPASTAEGTGAPAQLGPVLQATGVSVSGRLAETSLTLDASGRLLLTGPNGSGKSTLLALLAGALEPSAGSVLRPVRVGYLPQEVAFADLTRSAADTFASALAPRTARTDLVTLGLLAERDQHQPVGALSVGQRRRVALGILLANPPPVLLLDEPTNHLSLTLVEELETALQSFTGALVVASHDRWWRSRWCGDTMPLTPVATNVR